MGTGSDGELKLLEERWKLEEERRQLELDLLFEEFNKRTSASKKKEEQKCFVFR